MGNPDRATCGLFGSTTLTAHIARGAIAAGLIAWVLFGQSPHPAFTVGALILAVVAMRGCPGCWTIGLFETIGRFIAARARSQTGSRGSGTTP
jgi:hypothetical protein